MPAIEVVPPELTAAAGPLREVGRTLRALADDRTGMERFADGSPSAELRDALRAFVERWELLLWQVGGDADNLANLLRWAAEDYARLDDVLARSLR